MTEQIATGLTEDEAELYDRQIRLWGIEAQWKLRNARILVIGMDGLGAEIVKNITLSGVKSVMMLDDQLTTEDDFECQFLIPRESLNINRAEASRARAQALNPLVTIKYDKQPVSEKSEEYFTNFDMVICCNQNPAHSVKINGICRQNKIFFTDAGIFGTFGYVFYDLIEHRYSKETTLVKKDGNILKTSMHLSEYPSLRDTLDWDVKTPEMYRLCKKIPATIFMFKVLMKFQEEHRRRPTDSEDDYISLQKLRNSELEGVTLPESSFPENILTCLTTGLPNPICAIVGAVVAQEMVTAISGKGEPQRNLFFFDPVKLAGHIQYIGPNLKTVEIHHEVESKNQNS